MDREILENTQAVPHLIFMAMTIMWHHLRYLADLQQSRKPMGAGLSDKTAGSIISVLPVPVSRGKNLYVGNSTCIQQVKISDMIYNVDTTIRQQWPERGGRVNA